MHTAQSTPSQAGSDHQTELAVTGSDAIRAEVNRYVRAHEINAHPFVVHLPGRLLPCWFSYLGEDDIPDPDHRPGIRLRTNRGSHP